MAVMATAGPFLFVNTYMGDNMSQAAGSLCENRQDIRDMCNWTRRWPIVRLQPLPMLDCTLCTYCGQIDQFLTCLHRTRGSEAHSFVFSSLPYLDPSRVDAKQSNA